MATTGSAAPISLPPGLVSMLQKFDQLDSEVARGSDARKQQEEVRETIMENMNKVNIPKIEYNGRIFALVEKKKTEKPKAGEVRQRMIDALVESSDNKINADQAAVIVDDRVYAPLGEEDVLTLTVQKKRQSKKKQKTGDDQLE